LLQLFIRLFITHTLRYLNPSSQPISTNMNQPEDVEVILSPEKRYQFHSSVLARNSTHFSSLLTERNAAKLCKRARNAGIKVRWMLELAMSPHEEHTPGRLKLVVSAPPNTAFLQLLLCRKLLH
jgi:hypothetical protein